MFRCRLFIVWRFSVTVLVIHGFGVGCYVTIYSVLRVRLFHQPNPSVKRDWLTASPLLQTLDDAKNMAAFESESQELRICFRYPIKEIAEAASLLNQAVTEHLFGNTSEAESLIRQADIPVVSEWTESILGKNSKYALISAVREPSLPLAERIQVRMPNAQEMLQLHARDGYHCRFCGIPVIRKEVREKIRTAYPDALRWGKRNAERHAAFFAMWVQYDHLTPHSKGGTNDISNLVVTCSACNYGRGGFTLGEVRLRNPLERPPIKSSWDGLERFVHTSSNNKWGQTQQ